MNTAVRRIVRRGEVLLLSLALATGLTPTFASPAYAEEDPAPSPAIERSTLSAGSADELSQAVANAQTGDVILLSGDVDISSTGLGISGKSVVLDLNGNALKAANTKPGNIVVSKGAGLTVQDSTDTDRNGAGKGKIYTETPYTGPDKGYGLIESHGDFVLESGLVDAVLENAVSYGQFRIGGHEGTVTVSGGKIRAGWYAISGNGLNETSVRYTITGGILESTSDYAIYCPQAGTTVEISGGTVAGAAGGIAMNDGALYVSGGTITSKGTGDTGDWGDGTGKLDNAGVNLNAKYGSVDAHITGGTIEGDTDAPAVDISGENNDIDLAISGGSFSSTEGLEGYLVKGYRFESGESGSAVSAGEPVAAIGDAPYPSVRAAIEHAKAGDVVSLLDNTSEDLVVPAGADVTLDLSGFTLSNERDHTIVNNGTLTIADPKGGGKVDALTHAKAAVCNNPGGTLSIEGGMITRSQEKQDPGSQNSWYTIVNLGTIESISGGLITTGVGTPGTLGNRSSLVLNGDGTTPGVIESITGGEFKSAANIIKNELGSSIESITGGTFTMDNTSVRWYGGNNLVQNVGTIESITGGNFLMLGTGVSADEDYRYTRQGFYSSGKICEIGGEVSFSVEGDNSRAFRIATGGSVSVTGGSFSVENGGGTENPSEMFSIADGAEMSVSGGEFSYPDGNLFNETLIAGNLSISGGSFDASPKKYLEEKHVASVGEDSYVVMERINLPAGTYETAPDDPEIGADDLKPGLKVVKNADGTFTVVKPYVPPTPSAPSYDLTVAPSENGSVSLSDVSAKEGQKVTVTVKPDAGFELASLVVADEDGNALKLELSADGTYSFEMPAGDVTVHAAFECDGGELCPSHGFTDVDQSQWYHAAIDWAVEAKVLNGIDGTTLMMPDAEITRAQMAQVLWNVEGNEPAASEAAFSDVDPGEWYVGAISWAVESGVFEGYAGTSLFGPDEPLTREQAALVLQRWSELNGEDVSGRADLSGYPDAELVSDWALDGVSWAVSAGILKGVDQEDGTALLDPSGTATRAQVAALMMRLEGQRTA